MTYSSAMRLLYSVHQRKELMTEVHTKLSVVRNCSRSSLHGCLGEGGQLAGWGRSAVAGGGGGRQYTGRENLEQFSTTEKVERGLLLLIPILWCTYLISLGCQHPWRTMFPNRSSLLICHRVRFKVPTLNIPTSQNS